MESGSPSFRADAFPAGLRVLVVDDDPTWLKILEKMLKKCSYEVTTCGLARVALDLLRGKRDRFDIVISDVNMPDMDGFKLLEQLGLEMDLPVIMMSVDGETSRVMRGVQHGACDYLLKPVRMKELQNIWQHVFRRRMHEAKDLECRASNEDTQIMRKMLNEFDNGSMLTGSDSNCTRKRKTTENEEHDDQDFNDTSSGKKTRLVWSMDLHQKFFNAVNQIGYEKVGPKKILDLMNVPGLTRENVASHLQKYRLYLSRLQKQNESEISLCGAKQSDCNLNDYLPKFDLQNPTKSQQNLAASFGYAGNKSLVQMGGSEPHENELNSMVDLLPLTEERKAFAGDAKKTRKVKNASHAELGVLQKPNYMSPPQGWCSEVSVSQESTYNLFEKGCSSPGMPGFYQIHADHRPVTRCVDAGNYITDRDKADLSQDRALYTDCRNMNETNTSTKSWEFRSTKFNPASDNRWFPSNKSIKISGINDKELSQNPENAIGLPLTSLEDFQQISDKEYDCSEEVAINIDLLDYYDPASITELTSQSYDALRLGCENIWDPMEYTIIDEGLFIM